MSETELISALIILNENYKIKNESLHLIKLYLTKEFNKEIETSKIKKAHEQIFN